MTVLILERVPQGLRGDLSRWMMEVSTGVFVGRISGLVRDELWERTCEGVKDGSAQMIWRAATSQGFDVRTLNPKGRYVERVDGVWLARVP